MIIRVFFYFISSLTVTRDIFGFLEDQNFVKLILFFLLNSLRMSYSCLNTRQQHAFLSIFYQNFGRYCDWKEIVKSILLSKQLVVKETHKCKLQFVSCSHVDRKENFTYQLLHVVKYNMINIFCFWYFATYLMNLQSLK